MKYTSELKHISNFLDNCNDSESRKELSQIATVFRYESQYNDRPDTSELQAMSRRAYYIMNGE